MIKIGAHVSIAGGVENAPKNANDLGCECFQMFTKSPRGGSGKEIDVEKFWAECEKYGYEVGWDYIVHTPYYVNLASADKRIYKNSIRILREELQVCSQIKVPYLITHLGSSKGENQEESRQRVLDSLVEIHGDYKGLTLLVLEIAAGSGNVMGDSLEEIEFYFKELGKRKIKVGFCFDTCHAFASGYDLRNKEEVQKVFLEIDQRIGLENLKCLHFNDSKTEFNSKKDRHEHIGEGKIGMEGLRGVVFECQRLGVNIFLETNHDKIVEDIKLTKSFRE